MQTKSLFLENINNDRLIEVYANNIVFICKIRLCLYKIAINYLLFPFFMVFFYFYKIIFLNFSCFPMYNNVCII